MEQQEPEWYKQFLPTHSQKLEIIHFNDVYNLEEKEEGTIKAGAARFITALDEYNSKDKLVIFSGDLFSPSNLSTYYEGEQMIEPFNRMNVDISCLGNHELDFGIQKAEELITQTNSPWILSNLIELDKNDRPVANVHQYKVLQAQNFKIGFLGFAEKAWMDQLMPDIDCDKLKYLDYNKQLQNLSKQLKIDEKCDLIIAINHMRVPEDMDMASKNSCPEVLDMIFGGHDHSYVSFLNKETDVYIQKSGTDFEVFTNLTCLFGVSKANFSDFESKMKQFQKDECINIEYSEKTQRLFICEKVYITDKFEANLQIQNHILSYAEDLNKQLDLPAGFSEVDIEARFSRVRTEETNLGNLAADIIRSEYQADFGLGNGGMLRANCVFEAGPIKYRFLSQIFPMIDSIICVKITGKLIKEVLENAISLWPKYDGRWPCVSGLRFKFDPKRPTGDRIVPGSLVTENGEALDMETKYSLASKYYLTTGKDGFSMFLDPSVDHPENIDDLPVYQEMWKNWLRNLSKTDEEIQKLSKKAAKIFHDRIKCAHTSLNNRDPSSGFIKFAPQVEGRIINIGEKMKHDD